MIFCEHKMIDFGNFEYLGKSLILTEFPHKDYQLSKYPKYYQCIAKDRAGNRFMLRWDIINDEESDLTDRCDWNLCDVLHL